eukprot:1817134-Rhodomonas_salina.4
MSDSGETWAASAESASGMSQMCSAESPPGTSCAVISTKHALGGGGGMRREEEGGGGRRREKGSSDGAGRKWGEGQGQWSGRREGEPSTGCGSSCTQGVQAVMHAFSYALGDRAQCVGPKHNEERTSAYESDFTAREPERGVCSAQKCLLSQYRTPELRLQMRRAWRSADATRVLKYRPWHSENIPQSH